MIRIECTEINHLLRKNILECIYDLIKYIEKTNIRQKSKELNNKIENLRDSLSQSADSEETLNQLETNLEIYKNDLVPGIYLEYKDFIEWIFFYFDYDLYKIYPDKTTDIGSIESTIKTTFSNINLTPNDMETFEKNLKLSREKFEDLLTKSRNNYSHVFLDALKDKVDKAKEGAPQQINIDENKLLNELEGILNEIEDGYAELKILTRKEDLLGSYTTEDDRHELCKRDIEPMRDYVSFYRDFKLSNAYDYIEIRNIDFKNLTDLVERSYDIYENKTPKVLILIVKNVAPYSKKRNKQV